MPKDGRSRLTRFIAALLAALVVFTTPGEAAFRAAGQIASAPAGAPAAIPSLGSLPVAPSNGLPSIPSLNAGLPGLPGTVALPGAPAAGAPIPALSASAPEGPKSSSPAPAAAAPEAAKPSAQDTLKAAEKAGSDIAANPQSRSDDEAAAKSDFADGISVAPSASAVEAPTPSVWGRAKSLLGKASARARSGAAQTKELAFGDPSFKPILGSEAKGMRTVRGLFFADAALNAGMAFLVGPLLEAAKAGHGAVTAAYAAGLFATWAAYTAVERAHAFVKRGLGLRAARNLRVALDKSLVSQEMDFHLAKGNTSAALAARLRDDTNYLSLKNVDVPLSLFISGLYFAFGTVMMLTVHPGMTGLVFASVPVFAKLIAAVGQKMVDLHFDSGNKKAELTQSAQELLQQAQTVKAYGTADEEVTRYAGKAAAVKDLDEQAAKLDAQFGFLGSLKSFFSSTLLYIVGAFLVGMAGHLSFGQLVQMTFYAGAAGIGLEGLFSAYTMFKKYQGRSKVVSDLLARRPAITDAPDAVKVDAVDGDVKFENVRFAYPGRPEAGYVLDGFTLEAKPGQTVALVGETGSGKSTAAKLLLRLWEPTEGRVLIDGKELNSLQRDSFLSHVAVVPQETRLFNATIGRNMRYGSENASDEELRAAIKMAAAEFVWDKERFPQGLETPVSEGGSRLSGGERQRVAIVRAILRKPSILVLDEATSALDNESEKIVQAALDRLSGGAAGRKPTTLVVAHRLTTIRNADTIVFLEKGRIVESGTHDELLALNGRYAKLWASYAQASAPDMAEALAADAASPASGAAPAQAVSPREAEVVASVKAPEPFAKVRRFFRDVKRMALGDDVVKPLAKPLQAALWTTIGLLALNAALSVVGSHYLGRLLDLAPKAAGHWQPLAAISAAAAGCILASAFITRSVSRMTGELKARLSYALRVDTLRRLLGFEMGFLMKEDSGALASRLADDAESLAGKNTTTRLPLLKHAATLTLSVGFLASISVLATAVILAVLPAIGAINGYYAQRSKKNSEIFGKQRAELGRAGQEGFEQIQTVKTFGREAQSVDGYAQKADALVKTGVEGARISANSHAFSSGVTDFFTRHGIFIAGAAAVLYAWGLSVGQILEMTFYAGFIKSSFDGLASGWLEFKQSEGETEVLRGWMTRAPKVAPSAAPVALEAPQGRVTFENVGMTYAEGAEPALKGLTFSVEPGQTAAFVGESGSGKSTVLKMLQRLWDPTEGRVTIDGVDLRDAAPADLSKAIAVVPQDTRLFDETLRFNMSYGSSGADQARLDEAIRMARAGFVYDKAAFPDGLGTRVGEGGATLSGGQRQRVAIVRAILRGAPILVLDEATSALDKKTEREIQETLDGLAAGAAGRKPTTFVVAHNLTTVAGADKIFVMDKGRIVESGTHAELLKRRGKYRELWDAARRSSPR